MLYDLKGKIVLVTGSANGIGFSCVQQLLKNGAQGVTMADIDDVEGRIALASVTAEFGPKKAIFVKTNVTDPDQLEAAFKKTIETWKTIDVVINNAAISNDAKWELSIAVNANAVVRGTLLAVQYMRKDKGGKGGVIVNTSSILGLEPASGCPIYVATKHFVIGLSRSLGTPYHYNRTGIKIVTMCPGVTNTKMAATSSDNALTTLSPDIGEELTRQFADQPPQSPENVGRGMITLITQGGNGTVWVSEGDEPVYEVQIPDRLSLRKS